MTPRQQRFQALIKTWCTEHVARYQKRHPTSTWAEVLETFESPEVAEVDDHAYALLSECTLGGALRLQLFSTLSDLENSYSRVNETNANHFPLMAYSLDEDQAFYVKLRLVPTGTA